MLDKYKHYLSLTSQMAFCAAPIRLDSYNNCQFSCDYCFASARTGGGRKGKLSSADPAKLDLRLERVAKGEINSALDEFLERRIPIQFGGMSDPFSPIERKTKTTYELLKILKKHHYPFLLSTKGEIIFENEYLEVLKDSNSLVRFSFSGCSESLRSRIDRGTLQFEEFIKKTTLLRSRNIKFSVRLQPIIPKEEEFVFIMIDKLRNTGVSHISGEFLKAPPSSRKYFGKIIQDYLNGDAISFFLEMGGRLIGNEFTMPRDYRRHWLEAFSSATHSIGATFGFADNDLLLLSDGNGCCSGSDIHLNKSNNFSANTLGIIREANKKGKAAEFSDIYKLWIPQRNIGQYLNSKTRIATGVGYEKQWLTYARSSWDGSWGVYDRDFFERD